MAKIPTSTKQFPVQFSMRFENIIIWRHAEAEQADFELGEQDSARQLTIKGHSQAKRMAKWLKQHLPKESVLISSPAARALQTAEALHYKIDVHDGLKPSASLTEVLTVLAQFSQHKNVIIVGHQPWLGQLLAHLFEQTSTDLNNTKSLGIKKGAVWWLRLDSAELAHTQAPAYRLLTLQTPSLL